MNASKDKDKKKKKKDQSVLEHYIMAVMEQSMKKCLDQAIDDLLKDWK